MTTPSQYPQGPPPGYAPPPPAPKKRSKLLVGLLACGGLLVAFLVIGALVAPKKDSTTSSTTASTADRSVGVSSASPAPVGTAVSPAKDWTVKVTAPATLDANAEMAAGNQFNKPGAGKQFVAVPIAVTNGSDRPQAYGTALKIQLLPSSGVAINATPMIAGVPNVLSTEMMSQMQPGATLTGRMVFEVATTDVDSVVLLTEPQLTLDQNKDQRFLAIR